MKLISSVFFLLFSLNSFSQSVALTDFNWSLTDVLSRGQTKEQLFSNMNRDLIKLGNSICSNRALIWNHDFKRFNNIDTAKIFLFYTEKKGRIGRKTWWYHVSPVINEGTNLWVMDAGFGSKIAEPKSIAAWLHDFVGTETCHQIRRGQDDLIERMFLGQTFPEYTQNYGAQDCYFVVAPAGYWTPASLAKGMMGKDENGRPVQHNRDRIDMDELMQACVEAATNPLGRVLGGGKKKCEKYLGFSAN